MQIIIRPLNSPLSEIARHNEYMNFMKKQWNYIDD